MDTDRRAVLNLAPLMESIKAKGGKTSPPIPRYPLPPLQGGAFRGYRFEWPSQIEHACDCDYHEDKTRLEAEAEAVAAVLGRFYGLKTEAHRDYILAWGGRAEGLERSLSRIAAAVKQVTQRLDL